MQHLDETDESTLHLSEEQIRTGTARALARVHRQKMVDHRTCVVMLVGARRLRHEIAYGLHRLAADLYEAGSLLDAEQLGRAADLLSERLQKGNWR